MRESWTDERLDDLNDKVGRGFERIDADMRAHRLETRSEFTALRGEMKAGFDRVDERFDRMNERFEAMHRLLFRASCLVITALVGLGAAPAFT